jgi:hypothetical protein
MDTSRIADYALQDKAHQAVQGWLTDGAISAAIAFARWQDDSNVLGDVAEIGATENFLFCWPISGADSNPPSQSTYSTSST